MGDPFICHGCKTACSTTCYPRHKRKYTCHNTACQYHSPYPAAFEPQEGEEENGDECAEPRQHMQGGRSGQPNRMDTILSSRTQIGC